MTCTLSNRPLPHSLVLQYGSHLYRQIVVPCSGRLERAQAGALISPLPTHDWAAELDLKPISWFHVLGVFLCCDLLHISVILRPAEMEPA